MSSTDADASIDNELAGLADEIAEPWNTDGGNIGWIAGISEWTGKAAAWLVLPLMAILAIEAIRRSLFGVGIVWAQDLGYMLYATHFIVGAAYTLKRSGHIRTDFVYRNWSTKRQAGVDSIIYLVLFLPVMLIALWVTGEWAWEAFERRERVIQSPWRGPVWPLKAMLPLGIGLWTLQAISELVKSVGAFRTGEWPAPTEEPADGELPREI